MPDGRSSARFSRTFRTRGSQKRIGASADRKSAKPRGRGLPTPERTFLELAAVGLDLVALVVLGDSLIKAGRTTVMRLTEFLVDMSAQGVLAARYAVRYVREMSTHP